MALKLKYTDEHGILHINMSPTSSPTVDERPECRSESDKTEINDPQFDTINNRFGQYDLFGGKYEKYESGDVETQSLFRSRYNSIEEELASTPYAFTTERTLRFNSHAHSPLLDITIERGADVSPSKDIEDDRFFNRPIDSLFGPTIDFQKSSDEEKDLLETPAFTVTQLIHAQDRYFDLSSRQSTQVSQSSRSDRVKSASEIRTVVKPVETEIKRPVTERRGVTEAKRGVIEVKRGVTEVKRGVTEVKQRTEATQGVKEVKQRTEAKQVAKEKDNEAFRVLSAQTSVKAVQVDSTPVQVPVVPISLRRKEKSFTILAETPSSSSRPDSPRSESGPRSLPIETRLGRVSPFRGRGFREETSRHTTPRTSAGNSRANTPPPRRRTSSLPRLDSMAAATLPPPLPPLQITLPHTPRDFVKENIEEVRELSELNREKNEAEAEKKRLEEEEALLKEMGLLDQNAKSDAIRSVVCSRTTSRSNSPIKLKLRSRSNSPTAPSILRFENLLPDKKIIINKNDGMAPVIHTSRGRSVSKSQPQSNDGSPKHSKIPKRQGSVSPNRKRESISRRPVENGLRNNQRFISNSTSSIHETIKIGGNAHDKRNMSKSTQFLNISPAHIRGKPPIPGKGGPPPSNRAINAKRLSPIVGTPNKSPTEDKPNSARTPTKSSSVARKPVKTAGNTPATSRFTSRQPSRNVSRDPSPDKRRSSSKSSTVKPPAVNKSRPVARAVSTRTPQKPSVNKVEPKKPISRTNSMKNLTRTLSTKNLSEKPPVPLKKRDSQKSLKGSTNKLITSTAFNKSDAAKEKSPTKSVRNEPVADKAKDKTASNKSKEGDKKCQESSTDESAMAVNTADSETQYDKITNEQGDLVIMTKKSVMSMTTAAITSQPLEVVTKVTNQLPTTLEKAREKGVFERHSSKDSLAPKEDDKDQTKTDAKKDDKPDHKPAKSSTVFTEDNVKLKPLLPPYNNPQVERVKQRIDDILKSPEVSTKIIAAAPAKLKEDEKSTFKDIADKTKSDIKDAKDDTTKKFTDLKDQVVKQGEKVATDIVAAEKAAVEKIEAEKAVENTTTDIRSEASKIVDSIMTPIEEPKPPAKPKEEAKKDIEPIVMVVNERNNGPSNETVMERMTETLVKGEPEVEVQSSNLSTPGVEKITMQSKMADGSGSDKSAQSNGGFPQSTSTTPKPPARTKKEAKDLKNDPKDVKESEKPKNLGQRIMGKCKQCCACCGKGEDDEKEMQDKKEAVEEKRGMMSRLNCFRKKEKEERDAEMAAGKAASIEFESETKRKRKLRDIMCGCCGRRRRVSDVSQLSHAARFGDVARSVSDVTSPAVGETGCCGRRGEIVDRRDSILSDRPANSCCNNRLFNWMRGCCRRQQPEPINASRRQSMFSKNKSMSPTLPPEDTRKKLDPSLIEHTSMIRGAIPALPVVLAWFCLFCNIFVPGLGTIFSGMFCLCFGIPRFGVHDGAKHRIGSFVINLLVGCGQLFTVLFCLVGWGWSIWWGVIMVKSARKYRKLKAEAAMQETEAPPVTTNNHTRA